MIARTLAKIINKHSRAGFINIIYGPRRVGKTVLLEQLTKKVPKEKIVWFNGDTREARNALGTTSEVALKKLVGKAEVVVVDEAQRIENIGLSLKILVDNFPDKQFLVTGSSSLVLARGIQEPLTGRTIKYRLYPLSTKELTGGLKNFQKPSLLAEQLRFGGYPYLQQLAKEDEKRAYLKSIVEDYLFRDVLLLKDVASPETLQKLATLLAFQVGGEVSLNELSNNLGIDVKTVKRYLSLLKQSFVIFELGAFSRNLRKEVAKAKKYYFWDLGIRNALIDQFLPLESRTDTGALWENFLAVERLKRNEYARRQAQYYFWRTYEKAEIDWIEIQNGKLWAYEFKWKEVKARTPKAFRVYDSKVRVVSRQNYLEFVS